MMKKIILLITISIYSQSVICQLNFQDHIVTDEIRSTTQPFTAKTADLDKDGDLDIISSFLADEKLVWFENVDGEANFGKQNIIDVTGRVWSVFPADLDNDGDMDIIGITDSIGSKDYVFWYENEDGKGGFGSKIIISGEIGNGRAVYGADIDGDGDIDVVSSSTRLTSGKLAWYENLDGLGSFGEQKILVSENDMYAIEVKDLDSDNDLDILYTKNSNFGKVGWLENLDGFGNFGTPKIINSYTQDGHTSVYSADLDGDSDNDVIYAYSDNIQWRENLDGKGVFGPIKVIESDAGQPQAIVADDMDGDGDLDIMAISTSNNSVFLFRNLDGLGSFSEKIVISDRTRIPRALHTADLNNDGFSDILTASIEDHKLQWFKNINNLGKFSLPKIINKNTDYASEVKISDFNGDGLKDLLIISSYDRKISWFPNSNFLFNTQHIVMNGTNPSSDNYNYTQDPISAYPWDIDQDGDIDIIAGFFSGDILLYENRDGEGNFSEGVPVFKISEGLSDFYIEDMDGDEDIDIISLGRGDNGATRYHENLDGSGSFSEGVVIAENESLEIYDFHIQDLDGDMDFDLIYFKQVYNSTKGTFFWLENLDGTGKVFSDKIYIAEPNNLLVQTAITSGDLDMDGDIDLLSISFDRRNITWYENTDGNGTFNTSIILAQNIAPTKSLITKDIDGDGDLDILFGRSYIINLDDSEDFGSEQEFSVDINPLSIQTSDIDNDGDIDIATASPFRDAVRWHENLTGTLSVSELPNPNSLIKIYPNPANDRIFIKSENHVSSIKLFELNGRSLHFEIVESSNQNIELKINSLVSGMYIIKILSLDKTITKTFIKN